MSKFLGIYLFLLSVLIGFELFAGIAVAPAIFHPENSVGTGVLSQFQSGQIMSGIFIKMNKFLLIVSILSFLFEMINFANNKTQKFNIKFSTIMIATINLLLALAFILYFTDYILNAQSIGVNAIQTDEFRQIHSASELCIKILLVLQVILFFIKFQTIKMAKSDEI